MHHFGLDKNRELFRSFLTFEGMEQSLAKTKSAKKLKSNHTRTQSFKSPNSSKYRGLATLDQFLGIKKQSLKKSLKRDVDESRSKQNTVKTKSRLRQVSDIADITSRIVKLSSHETDHSRFEGEVLQMFYNYSESTISMAKAEMLTIIKYIMNYFNKPAPKKKSVAIQTDPIDLESYKNAAKRLIVNSDQKLPSDSLENNIILLLQKEILLDEILTILNEEDIDLNNLLSITLERIEANFYEPPPDMSLNDGVSLNLEDRMKMPTPKGKWADPNIRSKLLIDLSKVDIQDSESDPKRSKQPKQGTKLDLQFMKQAKASIPKLLPAETPHGHDQDQSSFLSSALDINPQNFADLNRMDSKKKRAQKIEDLFYRPPDDIDNRSA
jgi:hypothetical protein